MDDESQYRSSVTKNAAAAEQIIALHRFIENLNTLSNQIDHQCTTPFLDTTYRNSDYYNLTSEIKNEIQLEKDNLNEIIKADKPFMYARQIMNRIRQLELYLNELGKEHNTREY